MFSSSAKAEWHANGAHRNPHPTKPIAHGTMRGYRQEIRRGIKTCQACRNAWAVYCKPYQQRPRP